MCGDASTYGRTRVNILNRFLLVVEINIQNLKNFLRKLKSLSCLFVLKNDNIFWKKASLDYYSTVNNT